MGAILGGGGGGSAPPPQMMMTPPPLPELEEPKVMPIADPEAQRNEEMRKMAAAGRRGTSRRNTIIGSDETLG